MSLSDYAETKVLDAIFNASTTGGGLPTADPYLQLHSGDPGEAGTTNTISHTRIQVPFSAASGNTVTNSGTISVTSMPATSVVAWSFFDALTVGNCLWTGWFQGASPLNGTAQVDDEDLTNNDIESPTHTLVADDRVVFEALEGFTVPTGLTAGTVYFVIATGLADDIFRVSTTSGGAAVDITAEGQCVWRKVIVKATNSGDTFQIAAGDVDIFID